MRPADGQAKLVEAQTGTEQQIKMLTKAMQRLANRTDMVVGFMFEVRFRDRLTAVNYGRNHHRRCFTMWMAGAGVVRGLLG